RRRRWWWIGLAIHRHSHLIRLLILLLLVVANAADDDDRNSDTAEELAENDDDNNADAETLRATCKLIFDLSFHSWMGENVVHYKQTNKVRRDLAVKLEKHKQKLEKMGRKI
ncbi:hypothetical protein PMAYCL1PPCAC_11138, partial [Pristionchus mayeri]